MQMGPSKRKAYNHRGAQEPWGWPKTKAEVLLGPYMPIADIQRRLYVPWCWPEPMVAALLGMYRHNVDNQWGDRRLNCNQGHEARGVVRSRRLQCS